MTEQPPHEPSATGPLSFKGQMAARYRERMNMAFAIGRVSSGQTLADPDNAFEDRFGTPKLPSPGPKGEEPQSSIQYVGQEKISRGQGASPPTRSPKPKSRRVSTGRSSTELQEAFKHVLSTQYSGTTDKDLEREMEDALRTVTPLPQHQHPFHFGNSDSLPDSKVDKSEISSPQKKKRKVDKAKKLKKKKKKKKEGDEPSEVTLAEPRSKIWKIPKEKPIVMKERVPAERERSDRTSKMERPEIVENPDAQDISEMAAELSEKLEKLGKTERREKTRKATSLNRLERRMERGERILDIDEIERMDRAEKAEKAEKSERSKKGEKIVKAEKVERAERLKSEAMDAAERSDKTERMDMVEKEKSQLDNNLSEKSYMLKLVPCRFGDITPPKKCSRESFASTLGRRSQEGSVVSMQNFGRMLSREPSFFMGPGGKRDRSPYMPSPVVTKQPSVPQIRPVRPVTCQPTFRCPIRSRLPLRTNQATPPRKKLDVLIQYRRWREALLNCLSPSRIPLSDAFRKRLDAAVVEEWALHCWQPCRQMYIDAEGVWWSASVDDTRDGGAPGPLLGDGSMFTKEWILELGARLPYVKIGPVRLFHATYMMIGLICMLIGHVGFRLYHCGGDEYEYYCPEDDIECLMQLPASV